MCSSDVDGLSVRVLAGGGGDQMSSAWRYAISAGFCETLHNRQRRRLYTNLGVVYCQFIVT